VPVPFLDTLMTTLGSESGRLDSGAIRIIRAIQDMLMVGEPVPESQPRVMDN
jgi:hypothetical protein